ncbi:MAG: hypothetical protein HQK51_14895 [Oligoflexia bacterium]|nr:hypothetical protein [Oligoflexia bacterium]
MEVGKELICLCPKCNLDLAHIIEVTYQGKILKVMCKTCKHVHAYKEKKEKPSPGEKAAKVKKTTRKKAAAADQTFDIEKESFGKEAKHYSMSEKYLQGDVIIHAKFGSGIVREVKQDKILVQFKEDKKLLVHCLIK